MTSKAIKIAPSIAAGRLLYLGEELKKLEDAGVDAIHFDVMDGHFVPLLTIGVPILEQVRAATQLHLDVHIMVTNPDDVLDDYLQAGADTLSFHIEAARHAHRLCNRIRQAGRRAGIALNPSTHWQNIEFLLPELDQVTIMTVNPGYSRQQHLTTMHPKIQELSAFCRERNYAIDIVVDGGVSLNNAGTLAKLGATTLVAGGAVFNGGSTTEAVAALRRAAQSHSTHAQS
jgi:ribulose-phosphate 3-epimerase